MKKKILSKLKIQNNKHKLIKIISPIRKVDNKYVYWNLHRFFKTRKINKRNIKLKNRGKNIKTIK